MRASVLAIVLAVACAGEHRPAARNQDASPASPADAGPAPVAASGDAGPGSPPPVATSGDAGPSDAGQVSLPGPADAGPFPVTAVAVQPEAEPGAPDTGDLDPPVASAPPAPPVDTTCDASSVHPGPPGRHPGACRTLTLENQFTWTNISTVERTYAGNRVETERSQRWGASTDGQYSDYTLSIVANEPDAQGRTARSVERRWSFSNTSASNSGWWASTVFGYGAGIESAYTWSTWRTSPMQPPSLTRHQDFVIDSRGTAVTARDEWPQEGNDKVVAITLHANGVVASESWDGTFYPFPHESGETALFDDSGNPLQLDTLYLRGGHGEDTSHTLYTYDQGRLAGRTVQNRHYPSWDDTLLLGGSDLAETYSYDRARLTGMDSTETDATCTWTYDGQTPVSTCTWSAGPRLHTAYGYDAAGNLVSRVVTDANGDEVERYIAVADGDGNLLCESDTQRGRLQRFSSYDYGCW